MKVNLILDGNFLLHRAVFPLVKAKTLYGDLERSLKITVENYKKIYPFNKIWFVSDSKVSWRRAYYPAYKTNRKKDEEIDWEFIFNTYRSFKDNLDPKFVVCEGDGVEGDDWISYLVQKSNDEGESMVIIANDRDLYQLVKWKMNPLWINIMIQDNWAKEKTAVPVGYELFKNKLYETEQNIFELNDNDEFGDFLKTLERKSNIEKIDHEECLFCKIVQGDKGDGIPSLYHERKINKNGQARDMGIGEAGAKKIFEQYKSTDPGQINFFDASFYEKVIKLVAAYKKTEDEDTIKQNLKRNLKLIVLNEKIWPKDIYDKMKGA
jgi:5'-3' exonuclease